MRCERFTLFLLLFAACSRETPAPVEQRSAAKQPVTVTAPIPAPVKPVPVDAATYDEAMKWFGSAPAFQFVLTEGTVRAEGTLARKTIGMEIVEFRANGDEWRATATARGVEWQRRGGGKWSVADAPPYGNRVYQRVTLAIDPQKREGTAQLVSSEGDSNLYRFTNANSGEVHEVWVAKSDGRIERMKIGDSFDMTIAVK
ncbi:MAG TPA: hypothetical protein VF846_19950 [Thermoanaerobaculia bacterium]|jgi:hypothetical protein